MKKIKVLCFPIKNTNGGVTRTALKNWEYIDKTKYMFGFATCSKELSFEKDILEKGGKVHYISCYAEENREQFCEELRNILLEGYDVIHINTSWWKSFWVEKVAKELNIKVIIVHARSCYVEGADEKKIKQEKENHEKYKALFREDLATHFLACSTEAADFLFGPQIRREKIKILHNAIDVKRFFYSETKREETRKKLGVSDGYVLGMVGRLTWIKNQIFGLECLSHVEKYVDNIKMLIVGDGELREELQQYVSEKRLEEKVIFVGAVNNVEDYMNAMDLMLFPSFFEGLGNVLIEAQATGLKCVANDTIPRETKVTDNIEYIKLSIEDWSDEILKHSKGYYRENKSKEIADAGYDIYKEIKVLEKIYAQGE